VTDKDGTKIFCGVDVGASSTKAVLIDCDAKILARSALKSGIDYQDSARRCLIEVLGEVPFFEDDIFKCVATGYGRGNVDFAQDKITEITCHSKGCYYFFPEPITIVDIGGQDSKVIRLNSKGGRTDFKMNRKCAAGTGAFLEEIAARLGIPLQDLNRLACDADKKFALGSFCTVFAKTEILAFIRKGERVENIIRGAFQSVVNRIIEMDLFESGQVVLTGGVVQYNPILKDALEETLNVKVLVPEYPQSTGALGAALMAKETSATKDNQS